ncbi:motility associated factor glycosyltransferase family protein [Sporosarcina sp. ANT_H38]|uniref:motility associated factor glycosyltransferase family protein n=1 Tax=Sporosarcina sp. ANT_H38 TaxID=2597358 RepID=UPI0011F275EE|nr:6-hydroxymethylpterin diphosphokinase MptE-like protein [Sporosarcina sp. ANT_H38]KAA0966786.1 motility associated factor glycosyltransferase family protein [Sporosarcina sp. ANT_H38]
MILVDNRNVLRLHKRELLTQLSIFEEQHEDFKAIVELSRVGIPTLKIHIDGKTQYLHSKYDPEKEAERLVSQFVDVGNSKHILFVGCGLGYHIQKFIEQYPDMKFSIYEPNEEVLVSYLSNKKLNDLPLSNLSTIFTGKDESVIHREIGALLHLSNSQLRIYTLPVYESLYGDQIKVIMKKALESLKDKRSALVTNLSYQKRWTVNSIKNFPTVLQTPNILHDIDKSAFDGKSAIIVAAGPSLNEEFENLRYIKENGLAYIFSVGSAINALVEHGIYPDAACTYDPQDINYRVIQIIKDQQITDIPLVFGSSVGFETLENYPGKMLHMLVSQDTVAPAFLGENLTTDLDYVNDAPSIAVVTYQLLSQLGCSKIILVGQNLAYIGEHHYADGIDYGKGTKVSESNLQKALLTNDVYGNDVKTSEGFNSMRQQLEMYIKSRPEIETVNTTKGGALIAGTIFKPLEQVIKEELTARQVIKKWDDVDNGYEKEIVESNIVLMQNHQQNVEKLLTQTLQIIEKLNRKIERRTLINIEVQYGKFDQVFEQIKENYFYRSFIEPMIRVQNEQLAEKMSAVRYERNPVKKGTVVVESFHQFIQEVSLHHVFATELFEEMKEEIEMSAVTHSEV